MLANEKPLEEIPGIVFRNNAVPLDKNLFWETTKAINWEKIPYEDYWDFYVNKYKDKLNGLEILLV